MAKTKRQFYLKAKQLLSDMDNAVQSIRAEYAKIESQPYEKSYKQQKHREALDAERMAREKCDKSIDKLVEAFYKQAVADALPDPNAASVSLLRFLGAVKLSPAEYAALGEKYRAAGDVTACRILHDDAAAHGIKTVGLYESADSAVAAFNNFIGLVRVASKDDAGSFERIAADDALDGMIDDVSEFGNDRPVEAFLESEELARELRAQHEELTAKQNADFIRGFSGDAAVDREARTEAASIADITKWKLRDDDGDSDRNEQTAGGDAGQGGTASVNDSPL